METGHAKNVANFALLIQCVTNFGTDYVPKNPDIALSALSVKQTDGESALQFVSAQEIPYDDKVNDRQNLFDPFSSFTARVVAAVIACGADEKIIADVRTIARLITGRRKTPKGAKGHSASQMSFDQRVNHFDKLIELIKSISQYDPNETDLTVVALQSLLAQMQLVNSQVIALWPALDDARIARDVVLYDSKTGMLHLVKLVKKYVASVYGYSSPQYEQVNGILFKRPGD